MRARLDAGVTYVRVAEVTEHAYTGYVYDLEVAGLHNFVANHILVHNTLKLVCNSEMQ